mgnify:CR=1 FL=1
MVNAWSLLYEELNGTMDETYPIKEGTMTEKKNDTIEIKDNYDWGDDGFSVTGNPTASPDTINIDTSIGAADTVTVNFGGGLPAERVVIILILVVLLLGIIQEILGMILIQH